MSDEERYAFLIKLITIIVIGSLILASIIGITIVSILTDRNVARAEGLSFAGVVLVAAMGGLSIAAIRRRHRWRMEIKRDSADDGTND